MVNQSFTNIVNRRVRQLLTEHHQNYLGTLKTKRTVLQIQMELIQSQLTQFLLYLKLRNLKTHLFLIPIIIPNLTDSVRE